MYMYDLWMDGVTWKGNRPRPRPGLYPFCVSPYAGSGSQAVDFTL